MQHQHLHPVTLSNSNTIPPPSDNMKALGWLFGWVFGWVFGWRNTQAESSQETQAFLDEKIGGLDLFRIQLEKQEKMIERSTQGGQFGVRRIQEQELVRIRKTIEAAYIWKNHLRHMSLLLQTSGQIEPVMHAMTTSARTLASMNRSVDMDQLQRMTMVVQRESDITNHQKDMMNNAM
ncbi:hypothetical protein QBC33DRAFT_82938 [Phialemonium atrogriseum]|uniref:Uncharacterized protein n=1 Tax=Phialemonium atrogriseum TaxID=1093897 RepID=A0AAJ0C2Z9_9PEZI|nr:uncharacterized protein QBC33DRAFT_82938 [Phialemonium atrogriseum]KAK1766671.1 hypothetical protein QBC33DRAFT_82938 [Phialemonium atrogriseum]